MPRNREFDEAALLDKSVALFWEQGYGATSMADVASTSGVANGSLYSAYRSKSELFLVVFARYCAERVDIVRQSMSDGDTSVEAVRGFFRAVIADCALHQPSWGCLMLNTLAEFGRSWPDVVEVSRHATEEMESLVAARLQRDGVRGSDLSTVAAEVILVSQGLIQRSRVVPDVDALRNIADSAVMHLTPALLPSR